MITNISWGAWLCQRHCHYANLKIANAVERLELNDRGNFSVADERISQMC